MAKGISMIDQLGYITLAQYNAITKHFPGVNRGKLAMLGRNTARNIIKDSYQRRGWGIVKWNEFLDLICRVVEEGKPYGRASDPTD